MNKNSKNRRRIALANFNKGMSETIFDISTTIPNSSNLGIRKYTVGIGYVKRTGTKAKVAAGSKPKTNSQE